MNQKELQELLQHEWVLKVLAKVAHESYQAGWMDGSRSLYLDPDSTDRRLRHSILTAVEIIGLGLGRSCTVAHKAVPFVDDPDT